MASLHAHAGDLNPLAFGASDSCRPSAVACWQPHHCPSPPPSPTFSRSPPRCHPRPNCDPPLPLNAHTGVPNSASSGPLRCRPSASVTPRRAPHQFGCERLRSSRGQRHRTRPCWLAMLKLTLASLPCGGEGRALGHRSHSCGCGEEEGGKK
jgi:hypothetical protein